MTLHYIIYYGYIFLIFLLLFLTYLNGKKYPEITLTNLAFCIILFTFQISILTIGIQFYLLWKLYFNCTIKQEKNGNDKPNE